MSYEYQQQMPTTPPSETVLQELFNAAMAKVYLWMFAGLLLTTIVAFYTSTNETILRFVYGTPFVMIGLLVAEIGLVIAISAAIMKLSPAKALALFFLYAALNGVTMSVIFLAYTSGTVIMAFGTTSVLFGIMSVVGYTTKSDLTKWGPILLMGLVGIIIASIANMFLASSTLDWIITYAGILLFLALIVYDTKYIKTMTAKFAATGDGQMVNRIGVLGALKLYLDFINLFLFILRLFGRK